MLTLRRDGGESVDVAVSQEVARFDKLKVGDAVDMLYREAMLNEAAKPGSAGQNLRKRVGSTVLVPTSHGLQEVRAVDVLATVEKIDRQTRLVTLRGACRTQTLEVGPDLDLKDAKVGDSVHAMSVAASTVAVTPLVSDAE